ncbi:hypothetical protein C8Q79DRAFT_107998 [Trametes meyenii]|nr:hypothetical protein C8Q79DRAFT_107998 [Trametes meyenii]
MTPSHPGQCLYPMHNAHRYTFQISPSIIIVRMSCEGSSRDAPRLRQCPPPRRVVLWGSRGVPLANVPRPLPTSRTPLENACRCRAPRQSRVAKRRGGRDDARIALLTG